MPYYKIKKQASIFRTITHQPTNHLNLLGQVTTHNPKEKIVAGVAQYSLIRTLDGDQSVNLLDVTHNRDLGDNVRVLFAIAVLEWEVAVDFSVPTTMVDI